MTTVREFLRSLPQDERFARQEGEYFSNLEDIWERETTTSINAAWYRNIVRTPEQGRVLYAATVDDTNLTQPMADTESSDITNTSQRGTKLSDLFRNDDAEKAHLLSNALLCHKAYGFCAEAATGKVNTSPETRLKLLNGVKQLRGTGGKKRHTGLKHHKYNKLYLEWQKTYYDARSPSIIIIPLLALDDVLNWNGANEYDVMAITCGERKDACQRKVLQFVDNMLHGASEPDKAKIEQGRTLLETFVKALAASAREHRVEESFTETDGRTYTPYQQWRRLLTEIRNGRQVDLPRPRSDVVWSQVKVAVGKATLASSLPDPYNLAVKAAVNYSTFCGMALLPACSPPYSDDASSSNGEVNTTQGHENDSRRSLRDFHEVATSLCDPNRRFVEMFSAD